jgi:hypothetical protein
MIRWVASVVIKPLLVSLDRVALGVKDSFPLDAPVLAFSVEPTVLVFLGPVPLLEGPLVLDVSLDDFDVDTVSCLLVGQRDLFF